MTNVGHPVWHTERINRDNHSGSIKKREIQEQNTEE